MRVNSNFSLWGSMDNEEIPLPLPLGEVPQCAHWGGEGENITPLSQKSQIFAGSPKGRTKAAFGGKLPHKPLLSTQNKSSMLPKEYPISSHLVSSSSMISPLVWEVEWNSTTAPLWIRGRSLSKASWAVGWLSLFQST